ncbi:retention module-containing protein, partial [Teredinibacter waterburyi]|uniref:retention module-containing protein n=1 Tax=Teredinibacter waterburyi TaxID=1500538 RepID=UPI00165F59DE
MADNLSETQSGTTAPAVSAPANETIGTVSGTWGRVYLVNNGERLAVKSGYKLKIGDELLTRGSSVAVVAIDGFDAFTLGHDQALKLDEQLMDLLARLKEDGSLTDAINFDAIAQALEQGLTLDEILPAAAAGDGQTNAAGAATGAITRLQMTGNSVTPESGFETTTRSSTSNTDPERSNPDPVNVPPAELSLALLDQAATEDLPFSLDIGSQVVTSDGRPQTLTFSAENLPEGLTLNSTTGVVSGAPSNAASLTDSGVFSVAITVASEDPNVLPITERFIIQVAPTNDLPQVGDPVTLGTIDEDGRITFDTDTLLAGASDEDLDPLYLDSLSVANNDGELIVNGDGTFTFVPTENWNGTVSFNFLVTDGNSSPVANNANLIVAPVNDIPVAVADGLVMTDINQPISIDVLANDYDVDGDTISIIAAGAQTGTVTVNADGTITYQPNTDFVGIDTITYAISDGHGGESVSSSDVTVKVGNVAPQLGEDTSVDVLENTLFVGNFPAVDPDGDNISYVLTGADAALFSLTQQGVLTFINPPDYETSLRNYAVTITATDDGFGSLFDTQNIAVNLLNVNEYAPQVTLTSEPMSEADLVEGAVVATIVAVDGDGDALSYSLENNENGFFSIVGDSVVLTAAGQAAIANDTLNITQLDVSVNVTDGRFSESSATQVAVERLNDAVDAVNDSGSVLEDTPLEILIADLLANDVDVNGDTVSFVSAQNVINGIISVDEATGTITFQPDENYSGPASFDYTVTDGRGGLDTATVSIAVEPVNDQPSVTQTINVVASEDDAALDINLLAGASDVDTSDVLNVSDLVLASGDAIGVTVQNNTLLMDPNSYNSLAAGETSVIEYSYNIADGNGGSIAQTAQITITGANDAPVVSDPLLSSATEDDESYSLNLLTNSSDVDTSDTLNVANLTLVGGNSSGVSVNGNALNIDPTAYNYLASGETESIRYSYTVEDGKGGSVTQEAVITIAGANDVPATSGLADQNLTEDFASYTIDLND